MSRTVTNGSGRNEIDVSMYRRSRPLTRDEPLFEVKLASLYGLNQALLDAALTMRSPGAALSAAAQAEVAGVSYMLEKGRRCDPGAVARHSGELFACIARLARNAHVVELVRGINDQLHDVRALEARQLDEVSAELTTMCELLLFERYDDLGSAIANYHERRIAALESA